MYVKKISLVFILVLSVFIPAALPADEPVEEKSKSIKILYSEAEIDVDGSLDEDIWKSAPAIGELRQQEPMENEKPSQKTEVRVYYNNEALYFGITCWEKSDEIIALQMERDSQPEADDYIGILLDTFNDKRNAYLFVVSPVGMKYDARVYNNSESTDNDWDGIWYAKTNIEEDKWTAEVRIPFNTLSFNEEQTSWGFNFVRGIKRFEETDKWAYPYLDALKINPALAGSLDGLTGMEQGVGLDIRPFAVTDLTKAEDETDAEFHADAGVDIFYNITPNLKASVTINTDFAETEVDSRQINLSRFPIFFPEKRDFFLEGSGLFDMPRMNGDLIPFFSRRIGLYEDESIEIPIRWGAKVTGRIGPYNIGFLNVQTDEVSMLEPKNLTALRISRNLWEQSHVGLIFTNGNPTSPGYNRLYGLDFRYGTSKAFGNKNLYFSANYLKTEDENLPSGDSDSWKLSFDFPNDLIDFGIDYWEIGANFNPALGYVRRTGIKTFRTFGSISPRPSLSWVRQVEFWGYISRIYDRQTNKYLEGRTIIKPVEIRFESGDQIEFEIDHKYDYTEEPFEIFNGIMIPAGEYDFTSYRAEIEASGKRMLSGHVFYTWGDYYGGTRNELNTRLGFKPNKHFYGGFSYWMSDIKLPWGNFTARILSAQLIFKFTPDLSIKNLIQYDNDSEILGIYSKLRWIVSEGDEFFLVVQHNWEKQMDEFEPFNWRVDLKYKHTFRF